MKSPLTVLISFAIAARATAASGTQAIGKIPFAGKISSVSYIPDAALTGANTNTRKISVINKGQSGSGTTVAAELQFDSGVNLTAFDEKTIPNSGTAANLNVAAGDVLAVIE